GGGGGAGGGGGGGGRRAGGGGGRAPADGLDAVRPEVGNERVAYPGEVAIDVGGGPDPHKQRRGRVHRRDPDPDRAGQGRGVQPASPRRSEIDPLTCQGRPGGGELMGASGEIAGRVALGGVGPQDRSPTAQQAQRDQG